MSITTSDFTEQEQQLVVQLLRECYGVDVPLQLAEAEIMGDTSTPAPDHQISRYGALMV